MKILVSVKRVVDRNVKIRIKAACGGQGNEVRLRKDGSPEEGAFDTD